MLAYSHAISQPASVTSAGAARRRECQHEDFRVVKPLDCVPPTGRSTAHGKAVDQVKLELRDDATGQVFMVYKLINVIISSVCVEGTAGTGLPSEELTFDYGKIEWTYTETGPKPANGRATSGHPGT